MVRLSLIVLGLLAAGWCFSGDAEGVEIKVRKWYTLLACGRGQVIKVNCFRDRKPCYGITIGKNTARCFFRTEVATLRRCSMKQDKCTIFKHKPRGRYTCKYRCVRRPTPSWKKAYYRRKRREALRRAEQRRRRRRLSRWRSGREHRRRCIRLQYSRTCRYYRNGRNCRRRRPSRPSLRSRLNSCLRRNKTSRTRPGRCRRWVIRGGRYKCLGRGRRRPVRICIRLTNQYRSQRRRKLCCSCWGKRV